MTLVPFDPWYHLESRMRELEREFDRIHDSIARFDFDRIFNTPSIHLRETANDVIVTCDIPGSAKDQKIDVNVKNGILTIRGSMDKRTEVKGTNAYRREQYASRFQRSIPLPANVSPEGMTRNIHNGILEIRLPKVQSRHDNNTHIDFRRQ